MGRPLDLRCRKQRFGFCQLREVDNSSRLFGAVNSRRRRERGPRRGRAPVKNINPNGGPYRADDPSTEDAYCSNT